MNQKVAKKLKKYSEMLDTDHRTYKKFYLSLPSIGKATINWSIKTELPIPVKGGVHTSHGEKV